MKPVVVEPENTQPAAASSVPRVTIALSTHSGAKSSPPRRIQMPSTWASTQMRHERQRSWLASWGSSSQTWPSVPSVRKSMPSDRAIWRRLGVGSNGSTSTRDGPPMS